MIESEKPKRQTSEGIAEKPTPKANRKALAISLVLHLFLLATLFLGRFKTPKPEKEEQWIEVVTLPPESRPSSESEKQELSTIKRDDKTRIVQTEILQETKEADPNAFLGEKTQKIEDQKVKTGDTTEPAKGKIRAEQKIAPSTPEKPKLTLSNIGVGLPNPLKTKEELKEAGIDAAVAGQAASVHDYVPGVKEGERTLLNTKEYKYYSYFQRIRKQLEINWRPILQEKMQKFFEAGRRLSTNKDHVTEVLVFLNAEGKIVQIQILSESGTNDLDESAVNAFNKAGPFPNPPKGLIEGDGIVKVRWEFVLRT